MRKLIASLQMSLDGFIEGPGGEMDWAMEDEAEAWAVMFPMLEQVDACVLGRVMYPEYERYWRAVLADPSGPLPMTGKPANENEIAFARWADRTPHFVLSRTLDEVAWPTTRIVRDMEAIRSLKRQPGKGIYAVGGATFVSGLLNEGLVDELRLMVGPLLLGGGKALFKDVKARHELKLSEARPLGRGKVYLVYAVRP